MPRGIGYMMNPAGGTTPAAGASPAPTAPAGSGLLDQWRDRLAALANDPRGLSQIQRVMEGSSRAGGRRIGNLAGGLREDIQSDQKLDSALEREAADTERLRSRSAHNEALAQRTHAETKAKQNENSVFQEREERKRQEHEAGLDESAATTAQRHSAAGLNRGRNEREAAAAPGDRAQTEAYTKYLERRGQGTQGNAQTAKIQTTATALREVFPNLSEGEATLQAIKMLEGDYTREEAILDAQKAERELISQESVLRSTPFTEEEINRRLDAAASRAESVFLEDDRDVVEYYEVRGDPRAGIIKRRLDAMKRMDPRMHRLMVEALRQEIEMENATP